VDGPHSRHYDHPIVDVAPHFSAEARVREENAFLYAVIAAISSSLEREQVLNNIVGILREATDCHAGLVYLIEDDRLVLRAASPIHRHLVGRSWFGVGEGICGWVARTREPVLVRDNALEDPRNHYVPELDEEHFQSMVAVPLISRGGDVIGVVVLHTVAPREFDEAVVNFLVHAASLVAGAIENAELYGATRRRVEALTELSRLGEALAAVTRREELYETITRGARGLVAADACRLYRYEPSRGDLELVAASPAEDAGARRRVEGKSLLFDVLDRDGPDGVPGRTLAHLLWPGEQDSGVLMAAVVAGDDRLGVLTCCARERRRFALEEVELLRAAAHLTATGLTKIELIERLTAENLVHEMFRALGAGQTDAARERASRASLDLDRPHLFAQIERAPNASEPVAPWPEVVERVEARLRMHYPAAFFPDGHERLRALLVLPAGSPDPAAACAELGRDAGVVIGYTGVHRGADDGARALREAADAARMALVLAPTGGARCYEALGAYKYLVRFAPEDVPRDALYAGIQALAAYDERRQTQLLGTLEQFLAHWRSIASCAQSLHIHPNTLRQRLGRIREVSGIDVDAVDPLSLELAVKLARLTPPAE
jgi:GAF domain-containing protein